MHSLNLILVVACLLACALASTRISDAPKTLVLFEDVEFKNTHSDFLQSLVDLGHSLTYSNVREDTATLKAYGKYHYDNIILCAPNTEELGGGYIKTSDLNDFVSNGGSLLLAANLGLSESQRAFANSIGIDFDENESEVLDTSLVLPSDDTLYTYDIEDERPIIRVNVPAEKTPTDIIGKSSTDRTLLFRGVGQMVVQNSQFTRSVISANPSSASIDSSRNAMLAHGRSLSLLSASQTMTNSRVLVAGSYELFSNAFFSHPKGDNRELLSNAVKWLVHARGYLRARNSRHAKQADVADMTIPMDAVSPSTYRLKDDIVYAVNIEEYDGVKKQWVPYVTDKVQFEAIMLDPYVRQHLPFNKDTQAYQLAWKVPDVHGIYKFRTSITQFSADGASGVSFLENIDVVPIHPFRHDDYPRFVFAAYPYYIGAFSVMIAFFVFSVLFLYRK